MGKSVLLGNLARRVSEEYLENIVAYISLPQFVQHLYETPKPGIITSDDSILAVKFLINYISPTKLGREILMQLMTSGKRRVELFLDAFDELSQANSKWVHSLVATLVHVFKHFRIFITSRPQMQIILEKYFGVVSYNILPFDRRCQKSFLSKFWIQNIENPDHGKIKEFTNLCLDTLYKINYSDRDICGIPMQLFLLAEVFTRDVQKFTKQDSTCSDFYRSKAVISIFEMYRMYFSIKLNKDVTLEEKENAEKFHTLCALKLLLPEIAGDYRQLASSKLTQEKLLSYGIITVTPCDNKLLLRFVHQSFAEYIVAKLFADVLFGKFSNVKTNTKAYNNIVDILLTVIMEINECEPFDNPFPELKLPGTFTMYTTANPSIMYFLNGQMKMRKHSNPKLCKNMIEKLHSRMSSANLYQLWSCCAVRDNTEIISLVEGALRRQSIQENIHLDNNEYFVYESRWYFLLVVLAMYSNNRLSLDVCFNLYSDLFKCDLHLYCSKIPMVMLTPLHIVLTKGNYSLVEFFLRGSNKNGLSCRGILHACVARTLDCSPNVLAEKCDIIKLLVRNGACNINEIWNGGPSLLSQNVHLDLLKCLLEQGANVNIVDTDGNTLAHVALQYLSSSMYHQLLKYFQTSNCVNVLKVENKNGQLPLNTAMSMMSFDLSSDAFRLMLELAYELKISVYSEENSVEALLYFKSEYLHPLLASDSGDGDSEVVAETFVNEGGNDASAQDESMMEYIQNQVCSLA